MEEYPFFIWTKSTIESGQSPYILRWGKSIKALVNRWHKKYGQTPVKIQRAMWNPEKAAWVIDPEGETWEAQQ